jgi:hypothetical protein
MIESDTKAKLAAIKARYQKLGWLPREDVLWLIAALEEELAKNEAR